jgi:hypothetical protein
MKVGNEDLLVVGKFAGVEAWDAMHANLQISP